MSNKDVLDDIMDISDGMYYLDKGLKSRMARVVESKRIMEDQQEQLDYQAQLLEDLEARVKKEKVSYKALQSIIYLVNGLLSGNYVGPTPTVEGLCLRILELYKRGDSND